MNTTPPAFQETSHIRWYRPPIDKAVMDELLKRSDLQGLRQTLAHITLWGLTGTAAYVAFLNVSRANGYWSIPLLLLFLFVHGTVGGFLGGTACHELGHGTVFRTPALNAFFLRIFAFLGWWDYVWFKPSHAKHHQYTTFHGYDGEVVLPQKLTFNGTFWFSVLAWNPLLTWRMLVAYFRRAMGRMDNTWYEFLMPESNVRLRRQHRNWARFCLVAHAALAIAFIATGHWFLVFIVNFGAFYGGLLGFLCGTPQHYGMQPDVPDHRLCCRTYLISGLPSFLYWNMQHHIEHHMFPAVPFHKLPKLRKLIEHALPPAPNGLWATWREILAIHRKTQADPSYVFVPNLPTEARSAAPAEALHREALG